jgi:hypothetical protein
VTEAQLQAAVLELCGWLGLRAYHPYDSRRSVAGWPDLVIVGRQVLYRELKSASGVVSAAQKDWLRALRCAGCDAGVWRPEHWPGAIAIELKAIA